MFIHSSNPFLIDSRKSTGDFFGNEKQKSKMRLRGFVELFSAIFSPLEKHAPASIREN